jgi:hypothetical protein
MHGESGVIRNVKIYDPPVSIGSLYKSGTPFDKVDRTKPEGVYYCKTIVTTTNQLIELYPQKTASSDIMKQIAKHAFDVDFKRLHASKKMIFSFQYRGAYGPELFLCFFEDKGCKYHMPLVMVLEGKYWRQETDLRCSAALIAIFDLTKKHNLYHKKQITKADIDAFLDDCRHLDEIIKAGMEKDPGHYSRVQQL